MDTDENQPEKIEIEKVWLPVEQATLPFYGHELVAVRLEDGRIAAVLRWLCEGLHVDTSGQIQRIQRKTALTEGLLTVQVETDGGPQTMPALTLEVLPGYLFTIDEHRVSKAARPDVILFQRLCVKALADYFARPHHVILPALPAPTSVIEAMPTVSAEPPTVAPDASPEARRAWRQLMREWLDRLDELDAWRAHTDLRQEVLENRVEVVESQVSEMVRIVPEIMAKLGAQPLSPAHQAAIQRGVNLLHELTKVPHATIYNELRQSFRVGKYDQIPDARWPDVIAWFRPRIQAAERRAGTVGKDNPFGEDQPEQGNLF